MVAKTGSEVRNKLAHRLDGYLKFGASKDGVGYDLDKETDTEMTMDEFRDWVASRKVAAATIDIETCELGWWHGEVLDPYGLPSAQGELLEEDRMVGRNHFVRSPDSGGWVHEWDLSPAQREAMYARLNANTTSSEDVPF